MFYIYGKEKCNFIKSTEILTLEDVVYSNKDIYIITEKLYSCPIVEYDVIKEATKEDLYRKGLYTLQAGEYVKNGIIVYKEENINLVKPVWDFINIVWIEGSSFAEKQHFYKKLMINTNEKIKELNEIGLGGGADEAKLKLELERYKKLYMDSIHEEALKENQNRI